MSPIPDRTSRRTDVNIFPYDMKTVFLAATLFLCAIAGAQEFSVTSPDGKQSVTVSVRQDPDMRITWSTTFNGRPVILESAMDLTIDNHVWEHAMGKFFGQKTRWSDDLLLADTTMTSRDTVWKNRYGERSTVKDAYNGLILHFAKDDGSDYRLDIELRAYDEGIAFRYMLPMHPNAIYHRIKADNTEFSFPEGSLAWYTSWAQGPYTLRPLRGWDDECERPMTVKITDSLYAAVGEAGQIDFPRTKLKLSETRANTVTASLNDDGTDIVTPYVQYAVEGSDGCGKHRRTYGKQRHFPESERGIGNRGRKLDTAWKDHARNQAEH